MSLSKIKELEAIVYDLSKRVKSLSNAVSSLPDNEGVPQELLDWYEAMNKAGFDAASLERLTRISTFNLKLADLYKQLRSDNAQFSPTFSTSIYIKSAMYNTVELADLSWDRFLASGVIVMPVPTTKDISEWVVKTRFIRMTFDVQGEFIECSMLIISTNSTRKFMIPKIHVITDLVNEWITPPYLVVYFDSPHLYPDNADPSFPHDKRKCQSPIYELDSVHEDMVLHCNQYDYNIELDALIAYCKEIPYSHTVTGAMSEYYTPGELNYYNFVQFLRAPVVKEIFKEEDEYFARTLNDMSLLGLLSYGTATALRYSAMIGSSTFVVENASYQLVSETVGSTQAVASSPVNIKVSDADWNALSSQAALSYECNYSSFEMPDESTPLFERSCYARTDRMLCKGTFQLELYQSGAVKYIKASSPSGSNTGQYLFDMKRITDRGTSVEQALLEIITEQDDSNVFPELDLASKSLVSDLYSLDGNGSFEYNRPLNMKLAAECKVTGSTTVSNAIRVTAIGLSAEYEAAGIGAHGYRYKFRNDESLTHYIQFTILRPRAIQTSANFDVRLNLTINGKSDDYVFNMRMIEALYAGQKMMVYRGRLPINATSYMVLGDVFVYPYAYYPTVNVPITQDNIQVRTVNMAPIGNAAGYVRKIFDINSTGVTNVTQQTDFLVINGLPVRRLAALGHTWKNSLGADTFAHDLYYYLDYPIWNENGLPKLTDYRVAIDNGHLCTVGNRNSPPTPGVSEQVYNKFTTPRKFIAVNRSQGYATATGTPLISIDESTFSLSVDAESQSWKYKDQSGNEMFNFWHVNLPDLGRPSGGIHIVTPFHVRCNDVTDFEVTELNAPEGIYTITGLTELEQKFVTYISTLMAIAASFAQRLDSLEEWRENSEAIIEQLQASLAATQAELKAAIYDWTHPSGWEKFGKWCVGVGSVVQAFAPRIGLGMQSVGALTLGIVNIAEGETVMGLTELAISAGLGYLSYKGSNDQDLNRMYKKHEIDDVKKLKPEHFGTTVGTSYNVTPAASPRPPRYEDIDFGEDQLGGMATVEYCNTNIFESKNGGIDIEYDAGGAETSVEMREIIAETSNNPFHDAEEVEISSVTFNVNGSIKDFDTSSSYNDDGILFPTGSIDGDVQASIDYTLEYVPTYQAEHPDVIRQRQERQAIWSKERHEALLNKVYLKQLINQSVIRPMNLAEDDFRTALRTYYTRNATSPTSRVPVTDDSWAAISNIFYDLRKPPKPQPEAPSKSSSSTINGITNINEYRMWDYRRYKQYADLLRGKAFSSDTFDSFVQRAVDHGKYLQFSSMPTAGARTYITWLNGNDVRCYVGSTTTMTPLRCVDFVATTHSDGVRDYVVSTHDVTGPQATLPGNLYYDERRRSYDFVRLYIIFDTVAPQCYEIWDYDELELQYYVVSSRPLDPKYKFFNATRCLTWQNSRDIEKQWLLSLEQIGIMRYEYFRPCTRIPLASGKRLFVVHQVGITDSS